jgi:CRP/FNR family transcriptional regulator, cyclic AMP receptor protein
MTVIESIKNSPLFKGLAEKDCALLAEISGLRKLNAGENLFFEKDQSKALFLVVKGTIAIKKYSAKGEQDVTKIGSGGHLGEMALLSFDGVPEARSASAEAGEHSEVVEVPFEQLEHAMAKTPSIAAVFYKNLAVTLSGRIRRTTEDLAGLKALRLRIV